MRIVRFEQAGRAHYGRILGPDPEGDVEVWSAAPWLGGSATGERCASSSVRRLAPVTPSKIVCVGRNYAAHARELGNAVPDEPLIFLKPPSALLEPGGEIVVPASSARVEHEAEIGLVIGRQLKRADAAAAERAVYGITAVNDVTARDIQRKEVQFTRAKGFDSFCPVGPWIETDFSLGGLWVRGRVNGQERQHGRADQMIFGFGALLSFISHVMTLEPGDLVSTGTPEGVGPLLPGDSVEIEVSGLGVLKNRVRAPAAG